MTQTFLTGSPEYVDTVLTLWLSSQRLQILHLFTPNRCSLIFLAPFISCLSAHTACYQTDLFKYSPHSAQTAAICGIKMNCSLSYHLHFFNYAARQEGKGENERIWVKKDLFECLSHCWPECHESKEKEKGMFRAVGGNAAWDHRKSCSHWSMMLPGHSQESGHAGSVSHIAEQNVTVMHKSSEEIEKGRVRMLRDGIYGSSAIC